MNFSDSTVTSLEVINGNDKMEMIKTHLTFFFKLALWHRTSSHRSKFCAVEKSHIVNKPQTLVSTLQHSSPRCSHPRTDGMLGIANRYIAKFGHSNGGA